MDLQSQLSRRERQIMDIIYARGEAPASVVLAELPDPPARGALGRMLRILEEKGHLKHRKEGREYVYVPTVSRKKVGPSAMRRVVETFFGGSLDQAVAAHLTENADEVSDDELKRLARLIREARKKGQ
jgi:predicted transcriptional regulator